MKKITFLISFCFAIGGSSLAQDFRGFTWGSTLDNVHAAEKSILLSSIGNDELIYKDIVAGADCNVIYLFNDNNKLASGIYLFSKSYSNPQLYIQDYKKFKTLLTQKYGKPANELESWSKSVTAEEKLDYGQAVTEGNLSLSSTWNTGRTVIKILLAKTNEGKPCLQIHYTTLSLDELENKDQLKESLKKL